VAGLSPRPSEKRHDLFRVTLRQKRDYEIYQTPKRLNRKKSEIVIAPEPFDLRSGIPVDNITLFILEIPGDDNKDIPFADPDFLLDLSLDPAKARDAIKTLDADMVCSHHEFGTAKHFAVPFLGQLHPDDFIARGGSRFLVRQCNLSCFLNQRNFIA